MLTYVIIGVIAVVVLFLIVVALQPNDFRISRTATMRAPAAAAFAQVNDFHHWERWSPWLKLDPNAKVTFSGAPAGEGAVYAWDGNKDVGAGSSTIVASRPNELVKIRLDFLRPFAATNTAEFSFKPVGDETAVTWTMFGQKNKFFFKVFHLCLNMDKMVGSQFEKGLADMKKIVEAESGRPVLEVTN